MRRRTITAVAVALGIASTLGAETRTQASSSAQDDFNGDGRSDLVIGVPLEDIGATADAGAVHVLAGTAAGVRARGSQFWNEDSAGVSGATAANDRFGSSFAGGDFDDDSYSDLAVGIPCQTVGAATCAGSVIVFYGSPFGLSTDGSDTIDQDTVGVPGFAETDDAFGSALAAGDFDGDGRDDLAVGAPGEAVGATANAGVVYILVGGADGIEGAGARMILPAAVGEVAETDDRFGETLASGNFDGNAFADLVIASPGESGAVAGIGSITSIVGSETGLDLGEAVSFTQDSAGVPGRAEVGDRFGTTLAAGDFDGDGNDDLAVGAPEEALGAVGGAGAIHLFDGSDASLTVTGSRAIWQGEGMRGAAESDDLTGAALAAGDFDNDGRDDLAVGVPGETYSGFQHGGQVLVMRGTDIGLNQVGTVTLHQDVAGVAEVPEDDDRFGGALDAADYNGDGRDDLAVGVDETFAVVSAGGVHVFFGAASGISTNDDQFFGQDSVAIPDTAEISDRFGSVL